MNRGVLAGRRLAAIKEIEDKTGIDISRAVLPKAPDGEHFQLFQLEKLAREIQEDNQVEMILEKLGSISGVGPALMEKIVEALAE